MHRAMDVSVVVLVIVGNGFDDRAWFLRSGRVIQVNQFPAVDRLRQDRKIAAEPLHVKLCGLFAQTGQFAGQGRHAISSQLLPRSSLRSP